MKADDLRRSIENKVSDCKLNWYIGIVAGNIRIHGNMRNHTDNDLLATIAFNGDTPTLRLETENQAINQIILEIYDSLVHVSEETETEDGSFPVYIVISGILFVLAACVVIGSFFYAISRSIPY
jgi:hypothetical protein